MAAPVPAPEPGGGERDPGDLVPAAIRRSPSSDQGKERDSPRPIEEMAGKRLGVKRWERPPIFRETTAAAVDNDLDYWLVLVLSGAMVLEALHAAGMDTVVVGPLPE